MMHSSRQPLNQSCSHLKIGRLRLSNLAKLIKKLKRIISKNYRSIYFRCCVIQSRQTLSSGRNDRGRDSLRSVLIDPLTIRNIVGIFPPHRGCFHDQSDSVFALGDKLRLTSDVETIGVLAGGIANRNASLPTLNRLLYLDVLPSLNNFFPLLSPRLSFSSDNLNRGFFRCCCTQHDDTGWSNIRKRRDNNRVENNKYQCFPV